MNEHLVYVVLDAECSIDLWALSRLGHVWLASSPHNDSLARAVWDREPGAYSTLSGVSTFEPQNNPGDSLYSVLDLIDSHHDEHSSPSQWDAVHVLGLFSNQADRQRITDVLGFDSVILESEPASFTIRRAAQPGDADGCRLRRHR